jgi:hypothetical protein
MKPYVETYKSSPHGRHGLTYHCMSCHGEMGVGSLKSKYLGNLVSHALDGPPRLYAQLKNVTPNPEVDFQYPPVPNERCLLCHAENAWGRDADPLTPESHATPIDVVDEFLSAVQSPETQECKYCHPAISHPTDGKLIPTERGEKYDFAHPAFSYFYDSGHPMLIDIAAMKQLHWNISKNRWIMVNGMQREINMKTCRKCHRGSLRPKEVAEECEGCHSGRRVVKPSRMSTVEWLRKVMGDAQIGDIEKEVRVHYTGKLVEYAEREGLPRRTCVDCHGPVGTVISGGATDPSLISWLDDKKVFSVDRRVHEAVHENLTVDLPVKSPKNGRVMACEECHVVGDEGNYIAIHMQHGSGSCETCHPRMGEHIKEKAPERCEACHFYVLRE